MTHAWMALYDLAVKVAVATPDPVKGWGFHLAYNLHVNLLPHHFLVP